MKPYEREFFVSRICAGYLRYKINDTVLRIHYPSTDILYEAEQIFMDSYQDSLAAGLMDDVDIYGLLVETGRWTEKNEEELNNILPKHIEEFKVQLWDCAFRTSDRQHVRKYLKKAQDELIRLNNVRHSYDYVSCDGTASFAKWRYIVEKSTTSVDNRPCDWDILNANPYTALQFFYANTISDTNMRELARTSPWENIWSTSKKTGDLFGRSAINTTLEQQRLVMWSNLYDSVASLPDCPSQALIDDDDILDGFLIKKRRERESDTQKNQVESMLTNDKIAGSAEVFIPVNTVDDAKKIEAANDMRASSIKRGRVKHLKQAGTLKEHEFADVKQNRMIQANNAYRDAMKGK